MYLEFFKLKDYPFRLTPDPEYFYLSKDHARAKAYMDYSLWKQDSFVVITGEIGSGKTTLIEHLLSSAGKEAKIIKIYQTQLDEVELLQAMLVELGQERFDAGKVELLTTLKSTLKKIFNAGKAVVLIIDEAQNLAPRVLEEIRLLSGLETHKEKMLNVLLVGQPELNEIIDSQGLEQLVQRIRLRFHVKPMSKKETGEYIKHRLKVAGTENTNLFTSSQIAEIFKFTGGVPRLINMLCDTVLTSAFVEEHESIGDVDLTSAIEELNWIPYKERIEKHELMLPTSGLSGGIDTPAKLVVFYDDELIGEYVLDKDDLLIGRAPNCDIRLDYGKVSGTHANIVSTRRESIIIDLGSTNGTFVNGKPIKKYKLKNGDIVQITRHIKAQYYKNEKLRQSSEQKKTVLKVIGGRDDTVSNMDSKEGNINENS